MSLSWEVIPETKTIKVTGNLNLYPGNYVYEITKEQIDNIKDGIEKAWTGKKFKCYTLVVEVKVTVVADDKSVDPEALGVQIVHKERDFVRSAPGSGVGIARSQDPDVWKHSYTDSSNDATAPDFGPSKTPLPAIPDLTKDDVGFNQWDAARAGNNFAHEWGHVMGLSDCYHEVTDANGKVIGSVPVPGAPLDIMANHDFPILAETMTRLIRRNAWKFPKEKFECPLHLKAGPYDANVFLVSIDHLTLDACADDYEPLSGDPGRKMPPIPFRGTLKYHGEAFNQFDTGQGKLGDLMAGSLGMSSPDGSVTFPVTFDVPPKGRMSIQFPGVEVSALVGRDHLTGLPISTEEQMRINGYPSDMMPPGAKLIPVFEHQDQKCPE